MRPDSPFRAVEARPPRGLATRRRIYEAALEEFRRVGFEAASISRITRRAGVSRPSFYFHFPSKQHVLLELQWTLEHEVVSRIEEIASPSVALHAFVDELVEIEERVGRADLFRDVLQTWVRPPENLAVSEDVLPVMAEVRRRFEQAAEAGVLRESLPPDRAMLLFLTGVFGDLIGASGAAGSMVDEREDLHALVDLYVTPWRLVSRPDR